MANIDIEAPGSDEADLRVALQAVLGNWRVLGASAVAVPLTGDTTETALATVVIPAGAMGANGALRVTTHSSHTNNANSKVLRYKLGSAGIAGTAMAVITVTTTASQVQQRIIQNRNSASSQVTAPLSATSPYGISTSALATAAVDTSAEQNLVITGDLADAADTFTLESYLVEVLYRA